LTENKDKNEVEKEKGSIELPEGGFAFKPKPGRNPVPPEKGKVKNSSSEEKKEEKEDKEEKEKKEPSLEERVKWAMGEDTPEPLKKKNYGVTPLEKSIPVKNASAPEMPESPAGRGTNLSSQKTENIQNAKKETENFEPKIPAEQKMESAPENETIYAEEIGKPKISMMKTFFPILAAASSLLFVLLIISVIWNTSLKKHVSEINSKAISNAEIAKKLIAEKSKILDEYKEFKKKAEDLADKNASIEELSTRMEKQIDILTTELSSSKNKFPELQDKLKEYADEVKALVSGKVEYYKAYTQEKENVEQLELIIDDMSAEIDTLSEKLGSVDNKFIEKETQYIYELAFLNVKTEMYDEAIQNFKKFLELNGDDANVYYNLALLYGQVKHDAAKTIYYYEQYLKVDPTADDLYEVTTRINSLKRTGSKAPTSLKNFKINLNDLKY